MSRKSGYAGRSAAAVLVVLVVATAVGRAMALKGAQVPEAPPTATGAGDLLQLTVGAQRGCGHPSTGPYTANRLQPCLRLGMLYLDLQSASCHVPSSGMGSTPSTMSLRAPLSCPNTHRAVHTCLCVCVQGRLLYREGPTANTAELHVSLPRGNHTRAATPPRASGGDATTTIVDATGAVQQLGAGNSGSRVDGADDIGGGSDADGGDSDSSGVASGGDAVKVYYLPEDDFWYLKSYYRSMSVISLVGAGCGVEGCVL